jgi:hypothetical protein
LTGEIHLGVGQARRDDDGNWCGCELRTRRDAGRQAQATAFRPSWAKKIVVRIFFIFLIPSVRIANFFPAFSAKIYFL